MLADKLKTLAEDRSLRAILLTGQGDHFMNGHDLAPYMVMDQETIFSKIQFYYAAIREFQSMDRPVISAVKGRVSGAGLSLMLASDLVIAAENTVFTSDFLSHAMVPDGGATLFLARKVGAAKAAEIFFLGEDFSARQALEWKLINKIVPAENLQPEALAWSAKLAAGPTRAIAATKKLIAKAFEHDLHAHLGVETSGWGSNSKTFDLREAMKALTAKREPKFTGS